MESIQPPDPAPQRPQSAWHSPWVRGWVALVVTVLAVNGVMITLSIQTSPGLVSPDYYQRGHDYAALRAAREAALPEGWRVRLDLAQPLRQDLPATIRLAATDQLGRPVEADEVLLFAYRPADAEADFQATLATQAPGVTGTEVTFPLPGIWDLIVQMRAGDRLYDVARRVQVQRR